MSSSTPASAAALSRASARPVSRRVATVRQPARAAAIAAARPMPEEVPVIRTVRAAVAEEAEAEEVDMAGPFRGVIYVRAHTL